MTKYEIKDGRSFQQAMQAIEGKLRIKVDAVNEAVAQAVADCALDCLGRSIQRAPVESGDLRSSGYAKLNGNMYAKGSGDNSGSAGVSVVGTVPNDSRIDGEVGYSLPYANKQHEDVSLRHDRTDGYRRPDGSTVNMVAGGEAKYLESVVVENVDKWNAHIKAAAKRGFAEGE